MKSFKYIMLTLVCTTLLCGCANSEDKKFIGLANPWIDCKTSMSCAEKKAGFEFPVEIKNAKIRAMDGIIEVSFPIDETKSAVLRKGILTDIDLSGDYNEYPNTNLIKFPDHKDTLFLVRADKDKIFVVNFEAFKHSYSISSPEGITIDDVKAIYEIVEKADGQIEEDTVSK